jgi:glycosyltransferase involved in cell wall biosynthesis
MNMLSLAPSLRISVVMPFLNAERFIAEAIQSVLAQRYTAWELLLVDDGSSDGSTGIAQRYAAEHPERIQYLEHPRRENRGASASRNLALAHARGEYIAFLDADDVYLPNNLDEQVSLLDSHSEAGMVYGTTEYWYSWSADPQSKTQDRVLPQMLPSQRLYHPPDLLVRTLLREHAMPPCTCSLLVRREAIEEANGFEDSFRRIYTDQVLYAKLFLSVPVLVANTCLARYRQHPNSCCQVVASTGQSATARRRFLDWLEQYASAKNLASGLQREIRRAQWLVGHPALARVSRTLGRRFSALGIYPRYEIERPFTATNVVRPAPRQTG